MSETTTDERKTAKRKRIAIIAVGLIVIGLAIVLAISATRSDNSKQTTATTIAAPPPTTSLTSEGKILADYKAFWDAYLEAANPMRPDHPALQKYAAEEELRAVVSGFIKAREKNEIFKGTWEMNAKVVEVTGDKAIVRDCYFDHTGGYDATTGERKDTEGTERHLSEATLGLYGETWKVTSSRVKGHGCTEP